MTFRRTTLDIRIVKTCIKKFKEKLLESSASSCVSRSNSTLCLAFRAATANDGIVNTSPVSFSTVVGSRREESCEIKRKFPDKIPVIVEKFTKETSLPSLDHSRFLVPKEISVSQLVTIIRNRIKIESNEACFLLVNNRSMVSLSKTMAEIYDEYQADDGFLYVTYASQEVFG